MILTMKARGAILINPGGPGEDGLLCSTISGARQTPPRTANRASFSGKSRGIRPGRLLAAGNGFQHAIAQYINSDATARDMDIIRSVLGDDKLNYLGISYGTWLGTWYAGLFPERVGRMALIGNTDITAPLNDTLLSQEMGMRRVMDEILAPYAAENPEVFKLGSSAEEVRQVFRSLRGNLLGVTSALLHETIARAGEASADLLGAAPVFGGAGRG